MLAAVLIGGGLWWILTSRQRRGAPGSPAGAGPADPNADLLALKPKDLEELANRILVETDDAIRDSDQELGFAQAQFGDDAAAPFVAAVAAARDDLKGAFTIRQKLDDATPEDAPTHRQMLIDLVVAARKAQDRLTRRGAPLRRAPGAREASADILAEAARAGRCARGAAAGRRGDDGRPRPVRRRRLGRGGVQRGEGKDADRGRPRGRRRGHEGTRRRDSGDRRRTPLASARTGSAQGAAFLDAIDRLAAELEKARTEVDAELGRGRRRSRQGQGRRGRRAGRSRRRPQARGGGPAPGRGADGARSAQARRDRRVRQGPPGQRGGRRDRGAASATPREQAAREAAGSRPRSRPAQVAVTRAADYIGGQRGGIGTEARTRVAEANRHLEVTVKLAPTDAANALIEAEHGDHGSPPRPSRSPSRTTTAGTTRSGTPATARAWGSGGNAGSNIGGAIIGGIIGGLLSGGGGHRGGGFGGFGGGGGGFGGFGGGGGGFGGFGGSSGGGELRGRRRRRPREAAVGESLAAGRPHRAIERSRSTRSRKHTRREHVMAQSSILGRVGQLVRANINAILDSAEDPEKMLNQMVIDYTNSIAEAEEAVAQTIGNLRLQEDDAKEAGEAAAEWGSKAAAASKRADEMRAAGNTADADRFDSLAKIAIKRQIGYEDQVKAFGPQIEQQTALVNQLKDGLNVMRAKREELVQKKDQLIARAKMAQAQVQVQQSIKSVNIMDPDERGLPLRGQDPPPGGDGQGDGGGRVELARCPVRRPRRRGRGHRRGDPPGGPQEGQLTGRGGSSRRRVAGSRPLCSASRPRRGCEMDEERLDAHPSEQDPQVVVHAERPIPIELALELCGPAAACVSSSVVTASPSRASALRERTTARVSRDSARGMPQQTQEDLDGKQDGLRL